MYVGYVSGMFTWHSIKHALDWTGQLDWTIGLDNWTGQLDWTIIWTGLLDWILNGIPLH